MCRADSAKTSTSCTTSTATTSSSLTTRRARNGDVVTIQLSLTPENGFIPELLFDATGVITMLLGWGNYLPGLHELLLNCQVGDSVQNLSIDAGWGDRQDDLVVQVPKHKLAQFHWKLGESFYLQGLQVWVTHDLGDKVVLDANPPLAGASYSCSFTVLEIEDAPRWNHQSDDSTVRSRYQVASFALGCFWGAELAFLRQEGVVGTRVGYSHGLTADPTYDEVCEGRTQHRETVLVVYDPAIVSYQQLLQLAVERLTITTPSTSLSSSTSNASSSSSSSGLNRLFGENDESNSMQYKHGFYYHTEEQRRLAQDEIQRHNNRFGVELLQADTFYLAEEHHQKYLYKGGQSARKGARETIRCYG